MPAVKKSIDFRFQGKPNSFLMNAKGVVLGGECRLFRPKHARSGKLPDGLVFKMYRRPDDTKFALSAHAQKQCEERLKIAQHKLPALMALALPVGVAKPSELIHHATEEEIIGYTMKDFGECARMMDWGDIDYRKEHPE